MIDEHGVIINAQVRGVPESEAQLRRLQQALQNVRTPQGSLGPAVFDDNNAGQLAQASVAGQQGGAFNRQQRARADLFTAEKNYADLLKRQASQMEAAQGGSRADIAELERTHAAQLVVGGRRIDAANEALARALYVDADTQRAVSRIVNDSRRAYARQVDANTRAEQQAERQAQRHIEGVVSTSVANTRRQIAADQRREAQQQAAFERNVSQMWGNAKAAVAADIRADQQQQAAFERNVSQMWGNAKRQVAVDIRQENERQRAFERNVSQMYARAKAAAAIQLREEAEESARRAAVLPESEIQRITSRPTRLDTDTDLTYAARSNLNDAQLRAQEAGLALMTAENNARMGTARNQEAAAAALSRATRERDAANRAVINAETRLAAAENAAALAVAQGQPRTVRENFMSGFVGRRQDGPPIPMATQLGQAAKFSVLYGGAYHALFALTQTLQATLQEGIAWQDAMVDLRIATGRTEEELSGIAEELGRQAVASGAAPSQGALVGARAVGLYGVTESDEATQNRVMRISNEVVSRMAVGSGMQPAELQGQIAAIAQALDLGPEGQFRIEDLDAYMTREFGVRQGSTLQTVAESGTLGISAGFSPEELFAMSANLQARTGQTDSAVAGFLAQIFSRGGEGSMTAVASRYGVDPTQELADIVRDLGEVYRTATPQQQTEIAASFGRGRVQGAAQALLSDLDEILGQAARAEEGAATGAGREQFELQMDAIGGRLRLFVAHLQDFASALGESGLLDMIAGGVIVLDQFVQTLTNILRLFNELPRVLRDLIWVAGGAALALRVLGGRQAVTDAMTGLGAPAGARDSRLGGYLGRVSDAYREGRGTHTVYGMTPMGPQAPFTGTVPVNVFPDAREEANRGLRAGARGFAAAGAAALGMTPGIALAIGGLAAVASLKASADRMREAQYAVVAELEAYDLTSQSGPDEYRAQADAYSALAEQNRTATSGFWNAVTFGQLNDDNTATAERMEREAERLRDFADTMEAAGGTVEETTGFLRSLGTTDVEMGLAAMEASGMTAEQQLAALRDTLYGTADAAQAARDAFDADDFTETLAGQIGQGALAAVSERGDLDILRPGGRAGLIPDTVDKERVQQELAENFAGTEIRDRLAAGLEALGVNSMADLDAGTRRELTEMIASGVAEKTLAPWRQYLSDEEVAELQADIEAAIQDIIQREVGPTRRALSGRGQLSRVDAATDVRSIVGLSDTALGNMPERDYDQRQTELRNRIRNLNRINRRTEGGSPIAVQEMERARTILVQTQLDELEGMRQVALRNARSRREALRESRGFIRRMINRIVRGGGDVDQLAAVIESAGAGAIAMARQAIEDALVVARAAYRASQRLAGYAASAVSSANAAEYGVGQGARAGGEMAEQRRDIRRLEGLLDGLGTTAPGTNEDEISGWGGGGGEGGDRKTRAEREAAALARYEAQQSAIAARRGTARAQAVADLNVARRRLSQAREGSTEWYEALAGVHQAQDALAAANADLSAARAQAHAARVGGDLAAARAQLIAARSQLRLVARGSAEWYTALASLHDAQRAMAEAALAYRANLRMLRIDATNPLLVARAEAAAAAAQLRSDIARGQARDVIAQSRVNAQAARANLEATAFQQRLSAVQTAEELGRISHGKYMNYLENERERLGRIRNRTFQQQEQLDQIDRLIQEANNSMAGQFNFGDIKLPTPYQVRRFITEQTRAQLGPIAAAQTSNVNLHVQFESDTAHIKKVVVDEGARGARVLTTATRRR